MVKPDFFDSGSLAECSHSARLAFIGLWVMADDKGHAKLSIRKLKKQIFPFDDLSDSGFVDLLGELEKVGCIKAYEVDGEEFVDVVNFSVYQTVKNPSKTTIPDPPSSIAKAKRTTRFSGAKQGSNPSLTHYLPTTGECGKPAAEALGEEGLYPGTYPSLTHDMPPSNERSKEENSFPKEKEFSPSAPHGAVAEVTVPRVAHCPVCDSEIKRFDGEPMWVECPVCGTVKREAIAWR